MSQALRIGVFGPHGRMGRAVTELVWAADDLVLAARIVEPGQPDGHELASVDPTALDVVVDFTAREAIAANAGWCALHGVAWVLGTTGLTTADQLAVRAAAERTCVFQASNFSIGVALMADLAARAARVLGLDADVEVIEAHHHHKRDAPSGTALTLAQAVAHARGQDLAQVRRDGRSGLLGERPRGEIGVHALRLGDVVGEHEVQFAWPAERIALRHEARDRKVFALGALRAARWLVAEKARRTHGLFGMSHLIGS
ncbi:MAG: 4-hydroxy-tetrahydrodipicolinate reductase [Deltaproteobacteria bacterium]|nr:4-hydroxy-tetrahydrodipicolinate reductase [Deltaproteobacteria bacterium]